MTQQELKRVEVIALRRSGQIDQTEAARRLEVSVRQVRRLEAKVASEGPEGLRSARRGQPGNRRVPAAMVTRVRTLIRAHYRDFGPTLAAEYLLERHGIDLSKETVRQLMIAAGLWRPQRGPQARIHALRERRPRFGELIQIDGSPHPWFEQRGPSCCLLVFIDDATSRLTHLQFVPAECTFGYLQALYAHIRQFGLPMALYSDRHSIFRVNTGDAREDQHTQFGRALATLGIEGICANSPQAKGRVERVNGVLQDRLVKALRIAAIDTIDAANRWLPSFIADHNARFAVAAFDPQDAHVPYPASEDAGLRQILAKHYLRKLSRNLTCQFDSTLLQIQPINGGGAALRGATVTVLVHFDQTCQVLWRNRTLPHAIVPKTRVAPLTQGRREVLTTCRVPPARSQPANHPWKNSPLGKLSPEFVARP